MFRDFGVQKEIPDEIDTGCSKLCHKNSGTLSLIKD